VTAEPAGQPGGARGQFGERVPGIPTVFLNEPQRHAVRMLGHEHRVEPVNGEIERSRARPGELRIGRLVIGAVRQQEIARRAELMGRGCHDARMT
jgi:hypothetical protein